MPDVKSLTAEEIAGLYCLQRDGLGTPWDDRVLATIAALTRERDEAKDEAYRECAKFVKSRFEDISDLPGDFYRGARNNLALCLNVIRAARPGAFKGKP